MERFHASVDADVLSELQIAPQVYPPSDLGELHKWKRFGINSTEFDIQVMDPAYFKAICPGRGEQQHWLEAQEAAAEIFGRGRGAVSNLICGLEPMAGMLEGVEERISKGVYSHPQIFYSIQGSDMTGMRAPTAEWYVEAFEKIADIYLRYADTTDVDLTEDDRWGYTRRGQSTFWTPFKDEFSRRLQEMGKLPPGLPYQYGIEPG
jgi:biotin synthase-related radical SAM superfamily protein